MKDSKFHNERMAIVTDTWEAAVENYDCVYQIGPPLLKSSLSYILPKSKLEIKSGSLSHSLIF